MASKNETVHFVTEEMKEPVFRYGGVDSVVSLRLRDFANRIEAAVERREAAHKRELAEKDAEIERLKKACDLRRDSNDAYQHCIEAYKRVFRAQITDLTGALSGALDIISSVGEYIGTMNSVEAYRETLAKAREVCGA